MSDPNEAVFQVRERNRVENRLLQLEKRRDSLDRKRCGLTDFSANEPKFSERDVTGLAGRIKRRKNADEQDLRKLCGAFLQSAENISTFSKITGALNIIMKVFTATDVDLQLLAGECLCNLTLGNEACSKKVAQAAGTYLVMYMQTANAKLKETCLWVVQNLVLSGSKCTQILLSQGLAEALVQTQDVETIGVLVHEAWNMIPETSQAAIPAICAEHLEVEIGFFALYESLMGLNFNADTEVLDRALEKATSNLIKACSEVDVDYVKWLLSIRIFTNIIIKFPQLFASVIAILLEKKVHFSATIQRILATKNETLIKEGLWMAGTIFQLKEGSADSDLCSYFGEVDLLEQNLKIPIEYSL